jgi:aspartate aminotransferase
VIQQHRTQVRPDIVDIPRSGIREVMDAAWATPGAIMLGAGQPNFATPPHIVQAATDAALAGHTEYVANAGIPELRAALPKKIRRVNGYDVAPECVVVSNGGAQGLHAALSVLLGPGDGILLPDPGWPNYTMMARMLGTRLLKYPLVAAHGYLPSVEDLERLCDDGTKVLLLNTPSNPLGRVIPLEHMRELAAFAERRGLWIVSDECYDQTVFGDEFVSAAAVADPDRTISVYTFSKTYSMTGWRVGYVTAPARAVAQIAKLQEPLISCVNAPAQYAAIAALEGPQTIVTEMRDAYRERRDEVLARLTCGGVPALVPDGTFFIWADARASGLTSQDYAMWLLRDRGVVVAPGSAFGPHGEGFFRISVATEPAALYEGIDRIVASLS